MTSSGTAGRLTDLSDDLDHYTKVYGTFMGSFKGSSGTTDGWIALATRTALFRKVTDTPEKPNLLKVLSLGSGDGVMDCGILEKLLPSFPAISITVVEPSAAQLERYRKLVEEKGDALKGVSFDWRQQTMEEYGDALGEENTSRQPEKFHLVTAIHVIYYAKDVRATIRMLYDLLEDGGFLFISMQTEHNCTYGITSKISEYFSGERLTALRTERPVLAALDALQLPYASEYVAGYSRATPIFREEPTEEGDHLLDFATHTKDFRKTAPADLKEKILEYLKTPDITSSEEDGEIYFIRRYVHLLVTK